MYYCTAQLSDKIAKTPEGYLLCRDVAISRTGEFLYLPGEVEGFEDTKAGVIRVERPEEEVFDAEAIASFEGKSVTIGHPTTFVGPTNWRQLTVGTMNNVRRGAGEYSNKLLTDMLITDAIAIKKVEAKELREVSCGYDAKFIPTGEGRAKQVTIRGNHGALVPRGRAGSECAIFDSAPKGITMSAKDKLLALFKKTVDAMPDDGDDVGSAEGMAALKKKVDKAAADKAASDQAAKDAQAVADKAVADLAEQKKVTDKLTADLAEMTAKVAELTKTPEKVTHDAATISAAEILAPGIAKDGANLKADALKVAYATTDGKAVIDALTGGKSPVFDSAPVVDLMFNAAAAGVAEKRKAALAGGGGGSGSQKTGDAQVLDFASEFNKKAAAINLVPKL